MRKIHVFIGLVCFLFIHLILPFSASAEDITISTYYPAPFGVYEELRSKKVAIGGNYYDPTSVALPADDASTDVDLVVQGQAAIGTNNPNVAVANVNGGGPARLRVLGTLARGGVVTDPNLQVNLGDYASYVNGYSSTVGGGRANTASADFSTVAGGNVGAATGRHATVGGGWLNTAAGQSTTVAGGNGNDALSDFAMIGGGDRNTVAAVAPYATIGGGQFNRIETTSNMSVIGGGERNLINADSINTFIGGGNRNRIFGDSDYTVVVGGSVNTIYGDNSVIGGGAQNTIGEYSASLTAAANSSVIAGGIGNKILGRNSIEYNVISGGAYNLLVAGNSGDVIAGGMYNTNYGFWGSFIGGGVSNWIGTSTNHPDHVTIAGGHCNTVHAARSTVSGGSGNFIGSNADTSVIGGGGGNQIAPGAGDVAPFAVIAGGSANSINSDSNESVISGGSNNKIWGYNAVIAGGAGNQVGNNYGVIGGGASNIALQYATVGGGQNNSAVAMHATVAGGNANGAVALGSAIGGGSLNIASGAYSTVSGGVQNLAVGAYSWAGGFNAVANHNGSFVWQSGVGTEGQYPAHGVRTFNVKANAAHFDVTGGSGGFFVHGGNVGIDANLYVDGNASVDGWLDVDGTLSKGGGTFLIDHPQDPRNKVLRHSFVESPDYMNIYDGIAVLDQVGEATVRLPGYFETLNRDYRYGLTALDAPQPDLYIKRPVSDNSFDIGGGAPGGRVSWQVTGIRRDRYALDHPIIVEEEKPDEEKGSCRYPPACK